MENLQNGSLSSQLNNEVQIFNEEYEKFTAKGNKSAGTRARKALQAIRTLAFDIRKDISEAKNG